MRITTEFTQRIGALTRKLVICAPLLICGCAESPVVPAKVVALEPPVVQPEPCVPAEATTLQRLQDLTQRYEAEKSRCTALESALADQKSGRLKAEAAVETLRADLESLKTKTAELEALKTRFDGVQRTSLELENTLREVRRQLLEERLAGVKRDETIVALKIERAKDARKASALDLTAPGSNTLPPPANNGGEKTAPPRKDNATQETSAPKGTPVVNP